MKQMEHNMSGHERDLRNLLKQHGLRYSKPRQAILTFFQERDTHISAEALHLTLKQRGENLSLSTVYLNLNVLTEAGLVREFNGVNGESLYDSNVDPHYHIICKACGEIIDLPAVAVDGMTPSQHLKHQAERNSGWTIDEPILNLKGICHTCQRDARSARETTRATGKSPR